LVRRVYTIIFALGFWLCFVGFAPVVAQVWELPCEISCNELSEKLNDLRESHECCGVTNQSARDFFKSCCSFTPGSSAFLVSNIENQRLETLAVTGIKIRPAIYFSGITETTTEPTEVGPPQPLFLKNLSLLC